VPPGRDRTQTIREENDMKGTTKPKGFGIATILLVALLATMGLGYTGGVQPLATKGGE